MKNTSLKIQQLVSNKPFNTSKRDTHLSTPLAKPNDSNSSSTKSSDNSTPLGSGNLIRSEGALKGREINTNNSSPKIVRKDLHLGSPLPNSSSNSQAANDSTNNNNAPLGSEDLIKSIDND